MMFSRARQIQLAFLLPIGFLLARILYAAIFGGARTGSVLLLDLPTVNLAGPFAHVSLFGSIYLDGLLANLSTAIPFAIFMLLTGISVVFLRPKQLFQLAKRVPAFSPLLSAVAIGLVQLPALLGATARINRAIKMRREKRINALLPILETAIGTALAIAQLLALLHRKTSNGHDELELSAVGIKEANLEDVNLVVGAGQCFVITGPTGSGKSSILLAATGLASELGLTVSGRLQTPTAVGYVSQQSREQLFGPLVKDEISSTSSFGIDQKINFPVHQLSEGEAVQVSVLRELQKQPQLLILDEPLAGLDAQAIDELTAMLKDYLAGGGALLIAEHRPDLLHDLATEFAYLEFGKLLPGLRSEVPKVADRRSPLLTGDLVISFASRVIAYGKKVLISEPQLSIHQSEVLAITGPNGAGKTSLLNAIAEVDQAVLMVPELVSDFFVTTTLAAELERSDRLAKVQNGFTQANLESILGNLPDLQTHPRDLSAGTQLALGIAMQMSHKPKVLLIDEPARGFDAQTKAQVIATLECVRETGCALVIASHDVDLISLIATRTFEISESQLKQVSEVIA